MGQMRKRVVYPLGLYSECSAVPPAARSGAGPMWGLVVGLGEDHHGDVPERATWRRGGPFFRSWSSIGQVTAGQYGALDHVNEMTAQLVSRFR